MPFIDYPVDTPWLLSFAGFMLGIISAIFRLIIAVGPIGQILIVLIPALLFMRDIHAGPTAFKHHKS